MRQRLADIAGEIHQLVAPCAGAMAQHDKLTGFAAGGGRAGWAG
jgi:hypothetical protein